MKLIILIFIVKYLLIVLLNFAKFSKLFGEQIGIGYTPQKSCHDYEKITNTPSPIKIASK